MLQECAGMASRLDARSYSAATEEAQCSKSVQAWPRGLMLEATLLRVSRLNAPRVCRHGLEARCSMLGSGVWGVGRRSHDDRSVSDRCHASRASGRVLAVSAFGHGSPEPSIEPRRSASDVPDGDRTACGGRSGWRWQWCLAVRLGTAFLSVQARR